MPNRGGARKGAGRKPKSRIIPKDIKRTINISTAEPVEFLYFIGNEANNLIKIGVTGIQPKRRLGLLQTGSPIKLYLIACIVIEDAKELEQHLHNKYSDKQRINEWFDLDNDGIIEAMIYAWSYKKLDYGEQLTFD